MILLIVDELWSWYSWAIISYSDLVSNHNKKPVIVLTDTNFDASLLHSNISYILAAGWYHYLASTFEYLNHIYQKKLEESFTMFTLYWFEISDPSKEQNTILKVARQQFFIIHGEFSPTS